ncbi:hypothetical protein FHU41_000245 [Psychromicrobium silvestre]|uniref:Uncharacterized protein n=1 Tax=Psychromicrobium silvestre TaxID=1645614 RepID=A0A7Y9S3T7_9MICC|nr:hypothetical protein [Psychromicrobium silvestre]
MEVESVDERDMALITPRPSFRVIDIWLNPKDGTWDRTHAHNITAASLFEVQEWVRSNHQNCDKSEVYIYAQFTLSERNFILLETVIHRT